MKDKIQFIKEDINKNDAKKILDVFFETKNENYKKWLMEITPFKWWPLKNYFYMLISIFWIIKLLIKNKEAFVYRLAIITWINKSDKNIFYIKWLVNWNPKIFLSITRKSIKSKKNIHIDKMISIEKWLWRKLIEELCKYYDIYNIVVEPSIYWIWFWNKMKEEYKWKINITIK